MRRLFNLMVMKMSCIVTFSRRCSAFGNWPPFSEKRSVAVVPQLSRPPLCPALLFFGICPTPSASSPDSRVVMNISVEFPPEKRSIHSCVAPPKPNVPSILRISPRSLACRSPSFIVRVSMCALPPSLLPFIVWPTAPDRRNRINTYRGHRRHCCRRLT